MVAQRDPEQLCLSFAELTDDTIVYEYAVLVTSLANEILTIAQLYRDRADAENPFDELKNHCGWCGFTTQDIKRCRFMARITALVYNRWNLFVRLTDPRQHPEAITSRPLLLHAPVRALIIILPTLFSPSVAAPLQNMVLRTQTHMGRPALGGFVINAPRALHSP